MTTDSVGRLDQRVRIERPVYAVDAAGGQQLGWQVVASIWAEITAEPQPEMIEAGRWQRQNRYKILLRQRDDLTPDMRIVWQDRVLRIVGLSPPNPRLLYQQVLCSDTVVSGD